MAFDVPTPDPPLLTGPEFRSTDAGEDIEEELDSLGHGVSEMLENDYLRSDE